MAIQGTRFFVLFLCCAWAGAAPAIADSGFAGTALKFSHVVNEADGSGDISDTVAVTVADKTRTTIRTAHGYAIAVTSNTVRIRFTQNQYWPKCGSFNGLVIEGIAWPDTPNRYMADARLEYKMISPPVNILQRQYDRILIDFRGLKVRENDTLTLRISTGMIK